MNETEYLIVGAGPTGLGAATRLHEKNLEWHLLEAEDHFGGLAATFTDAKGFSWDKGGHVQFSHYDAFDRYMDLALGADGWLTHQRESWVWIRKRFIRIRSKTIFTALIPATAGLVWKACSKRPRCNTRRTQKHSKSGCWPRSGRA